MLRVLRLGSAALLVAAVLASGCSDSSGPGTNHPSLLLGPRPNAPAADSPAGVLRVVEWCWNHLDVERYRTVFTEDFRFVFGALDPAGNTWRDTPWTRENEIQALAGLAASKPLEVAVTFDRNFRIGDDPRPGKAAPWHGFIRTSVTVHVVTADQNVFDVSGYASFFVVRGDSAMIPLELAEKGVRPDSTCWYVERWEDDTFGGDGLHTTPAMKKSWGSIKALLVHGS